MKKIVLVIPPGLMNIGNSFIAEGARNLMRTVLGEEVTIVSLLNSGEDKAYTNSTPWLSPYDQTVVAEADLVIFAGGSCLNVNLNGVFDQLCNLKCKKGLIGASYYAGTEYEKSLYDTLHKRLDFIITRDDLTWEILSKNGRRKNVFKGIDCAFFLQSTMGGALPNRKKLDYAVVNIDSPYIPSVENNVAKYAEERAGKVIIARNSTDSLDIFEQPITGEYRGFVGETVREYVQLYRNAKFVATNRVHTFAICLMHRTPCQIFLDYPDLHPRERMYEKIGVQLEHGNTYTWDDCSECYDRLDTATQSMQELLTNLIYTK